MNDLIKLKNRISSLEDCLAGFQYCTKCGTVRAKKKLEISLECKVCNGLIFEDFI